MRRLSYSNVMATIALFVALSGSAYAATKITGRDIQDGTITGRDIAHGTLGRTVFRAGSLPAGPAGPQGERGPQGATGASGKDGADGTPGAAGPAGADGTRGPAGPEGPEGPAGKDGADGTPGADGERGPAGKDGVDGSPGSPGTAVAFATLDGTTVDDAKNLTSSNVLNPAAGVYCLKDLPFAFRSVVATVIEPASAPTPGTSDEFASVYYYAGGFPNSVCGPHTQVMVTVYDVGAAAFRGAPVTIWFEN